MIDKFIRKLGSLHILFTSLCSLSLLLASSHAQTTCLDNNFYPKVIQDSASPTDHKVFSTVGSDALSAVFVGGTTGQLGFIARTDTLVGRMKWRRTISFNSVDTISAMVISPDDTLLAAYGSLYNGGSWHSKAVLFIVRTSDGGFHNPGQLVSYYPTFQFVVRDAGLIWTSSGKIFMANYQVSSTSHDAINTVPGAGGRPMIVGYDVATDSIDFFKELDVRFNGYSAALAYRNYCTGCANLFVGGSMKV